MFVIQILESEKWQSKARSQHIRVIHDEAMRGQFFGTYRSPNLSNNKKITFTSNILSYGLYVDSKSIPQEAHKDVVDLFQDICNVSEEFTRKQLLIESRFRRVISDVSSEMEQKILSRWKEIAKKFKAPRNAVFSIKHYKRVHPCGSLLGQLLHTVRKDSDKEGLPVPTGGLEEVFKEVLEGKKGTRSLIKTVHASIDQSSDVAHVLPVSGTSITLTIDPNIQAICERELEKGVNAVEAKSGTAVMMDPYSGEVMAIAHYPFFNPDVYNEYYASEELIEQTKNSALVDVFEPGSVMKPLTCALLLLGNEKVVSQKGESFFDPELPFDVSSTKFKGRGPLRDPTQHKRLNMNMALQKSSNIYMARNTGKLIDLLGPEWYRSHLLTIFGIGQKTGFEAPCESMGFIPRIGKTHQNGALEWSMPTPFALSMGYNLTTTAMQLTRAFCIFANGGYLVFPTCIRSVEMPYELKEKKPALAAIINRATPKKVLPLHICKKIVNGMQFVMTKEGSGRHGRVPGYTSAGKSGTSEKISHGRYKNNVHHSKFVGFAPVNNPELVLCVCIDEPKKKYVDGVGSTHLGGVSAAPVFREITRMTLKYLGRKEDNPYYYSEGDPRTCSSKVEWAKETKDLKKLYDEWNKRK